MKKIISFILLGLFAFGCSSKHAENEEEDIECLCPHATIYLQPFEDFTQEEASKLIPILEEQFGSWIYGEWHFEALKPIPLPKESYVPSKNKYRTNPILALERRNLKGDEIIIGLTHKDICANIHNVQDYGIVGISILNKQVCIVSDKRLKDKSDYWKPILHEFIHVFYERHHCPKNDPTCIMNDAKGHGNFHIQNKLCDYCRQ